jgi:cysteine-rich repeat protein
MQQTSRRKIVSGALGLLQLGFAGVTVTLLVAACTDDPIVYPNRNLRAAAGAAPLGEAGEAGEASGGAPSGGSAQGATGGSKTGAGGAIGGGEDAGAAPTGPICGDGRVDPPEQCDDGNAISGDGCSANCQSSCEKCEKNVCPLYDNVGDISGDLTAYFACYEDAGKIVKGPASTFERKEVCRELVDCIRQEGCGQTRAGALDIRRCWCDQDWAFAKNSPLVACKTDPDPSTPLDPTKFIPGRCASLFQDASENGTLADVEAAFTATDLAEGRAFRLLQNCDTRVCTEECVASYLSAGALTTISADIMAATNAAGESSLGNLVADSQRAIAGADFALVATSFIGNAYADPVDLLVSPTPNRDADAPGRVLWSEALAVSFGYRPRPPATLGQSPNPQASMPIDSVTLTGQQLYDALAQQFGPQAGGLLFVSGLKYSYVFNAANPTASAISALRKSSDDSPIEKTLTYKVAVSEFLTNSNSPISALTAGSNPVALPTPAAEVLGEYLKQLPQPVAPPALDRITRLN